MHRLIIYPYSYALVFLFLFFLNVNVVNGYLNVTLGGDGDHFIKIQGPNEGAHFSTAMVVGDFNGDGFEDLAISAPYHSTKMREWNGSVSIYFGGDNYSKESSVNIFGIKSGDQSGISLSVGDLNNDGIDDLIIGSHSALIEGQRLGKVSVLFGQKDWAIRSIELKPSENIIEFYGFYNSGNFGLSTFVSDVDGDGILDLLVGAPDEYSKEENGYGMVHLYKGPIEEGQLPDYSFGGFSKMGKFGSDIFVSDINGDGDKEIIISAYRDDFEGKKEVGSVYFYKKNSLYPDPDVWEKLDCVLSGSREYQWFGFKLLSEDLNEDKISDLLITSFPFASSLKEGRIDLFYGKKDFFDLCGDTESDKSIVMEDRGFVLGSSLAVSKIGEQEVMSIIVGAPSVSFPRSEESGVVSVYSLEKNLFNIYGSDADDWFGHNVLTIDFNNDGFRDIVVGAKYADGVGGKNFGASYVFWGKDLLKKGKEKSIFDYVEDGSKKYVKRGEMVYHLVREFELKEKNSAFIENCLDYRDFCFFDFTARSNFSGLKLDPYLLLYPDNRPDSPYYDEINVATMLGIVNGHIDKPDSPFLPENYTTRIQALKMVLIASELLNFKHKFELDKLFESIGGILKQSSYFTDVDIFIAHMWWYPRYVNFAYENNIVDRGRHFRPDENITFDEFLDMMKRTKDHLKKLNDNQENF